jgi:hypothetical protein
MGLSEVRNEPLDSAAQRYATGHLGLKRPMEGAFGPVNEKREATKKNYEPLVENYQANHCFVLEYYPDCKDLIQ